MYTFYAITRIAVASGLDYTKTNQARQQHMENNAGQCEREKAMQPMISTQKQRGLLREKKKSILMIGAAVVILAVIQCVNPKFLSEGNLLTVINSIPAPSIVAFGFTLILITGGIDLSCGYGLTVCIMMLGQGLDAGLAPWLSALMAILTGAVLGAVNGFLIVKTKITPFIVTLATMSACQALLNLLYPGGRVTLDDELFTTIGFGDVGGIPITFLIAMAIFVLFLLILKKTKLGTYAYAIGSNEKNAAVAGINIGKYKFIIYVIGGICVGIGALILSSRVGIVQKTSGGISTMMDVVTAVVLGGTSTAGGEGGVAGTLAGVAVLQLLTSALVLFNVPSAGQDIVKGLLIILGMIAMSRLKNTK